MEFWFHVAEYAVLFAITGCAVVFFIAFLTDHYANPKQSGETNSILFQQFRFAALVFALIGFIHGSFDFEHRSEQEELRVDLYSAGYEDALKDVDWYIRENFDELYITDGTSLRPVEINAFEAKSMFDISRAIDWMR